MSGRENFIGHLRFCRGKLGNSRISQYVPSGKTIHSSASLFLSQPNKIYIYPEAGAERIQAEEEPI
jgi:hypothetical protein